MMFLLLWLMAHTNYSAPKELPLVQYRTSVELNELAYGQKAIEEARKTGSEIMQPLAVYDRETRTIYLSKNFDVTNKEHQAIMLHELVHHLQEVNVVGYRQCTMELEPEAYGLERKWVIEQGLPDPYKGKELFLIFVGTCPMGY